MADNEGQVDRYVLWGRMIARCWEDEAYKARLIDDPHAAFAEVGLTVPPEVKITVSEPGAGELHLVLPPRPESSEVELDDALLQAGAGGTCSCTCMDPRPFGSF